MAWAVWVLAPPAAMAQPLVAHGAPPGGALALRVSAGTAQMQGLNRWHYRDLHTESGSTNADFLIFKIHRQRLRQSAAEEFRVDRHKRSTRDIYLLILHGPNHVNRSSKGPPQSSLPC